MALETYALKVNGHRLTDIKIDVDVQEPEEIHEIAKAVAMEGETAILPPDATIENISIDPTEKFVEIFA